jgi:hypothetical protein
MGAPLKHWKVLPHGRLTQIGDNILTVVGKIHMPLTDLPRRMTVARLSDGRLVIYSAIALDEHEMQAIEAFGTPGFLVVPNDHHRLDARIWMDRYPALIVIAPEGAREKVAEVVPVDATAGDFGDENVRLVTVAGTDAGEVALEIDGSAGTTLVVNDIIGNVRDSSGVGGFFLRVMRFAGDEPQVPVPVKAKMVADKEALAAQLSRWAELPSLQRILPSHGSPIEDDPRGALRDLAASLR